LAKKGDDGKSNLQHWTCILMHHMRNLDT
jgi:hypothetical protein